MSFYCIKLGIGHRRPCTLIKNCNRELQREGNPANEAWMRRR